MYRYIHRHIQEAAAHEHSDAAHKKDDGKDHKETVAGDAIKRTPSGGSGAKPAAAKEVGFVLFSWSSYIWFYVF